MDTGNKRTSILVKILLPIARVCIRLRVPLQEVHECLKIAFIQEATRILDKSGEKKTLSRLSIITGLDRPSVKRIFRENSFSPAETPIASKVIGQWLHDPKYRAASGAIKPLTVGTDDCEFAKLVRQVTKNYSPGTMLQELLLLNAVKVTGDRASLLSDRADYYFDEDRALNLYARNSDSLSRAYEENITNPVEDKNVHIRTEYDNIYTSDIPEIRKWIFNESAQFHKKIREYLIQHDSDLSPRAGAGESGGKVVIGTFSTTSEV